MQIVLHVGFPKTGSSSIQEYLTSHRGELGDLGVLYPQLDNEKHHGMIALGRNSDLESRRRLDRRRLGGNPVGAVDASWNSLRKVVSKGRPDEILVLSSEAFSAPYADDMRHDLPKLLAENASSFRVLAYARSPVSLFPSYAQQRLKSPALSLPEASSWMSSHSSRLKAIITRFGQSHCDVRIFSKQTLYHADVVQDFIQYLEVLSGRTLPQPAAQTVSNRGLSAHACGILVLLRRKKEYNIYNRVRSRLKEYDQFSAARSLVLPESWARVIHQNNRTGWEQMASLSTVDERTKRDLTSLTLTGRADDNEPEDAEEWCLGALDRDYTKNFAVFYQVNCRQSRIDAGVLAELSRISEGR